MANLLNRIKNVFTNELSQDEGQIRDAFDYSLGNNRVQEKYRQIQDQILGTALYIREEWKREALAMPAAREAIDAFHRGRLHGLEDSLASIREIGKPLVPATIDVDVWATHVGADIRHEVARRDADKSLEETLTRGAGRERGSHEHNHKREQESPALGMGM